MRVAPKVELTDEARAQLERWARGRSTPVRLVQRASIILRAAEGAENKVIAQEFGLTRRSVGVWRWRFVREGIEGIEKDKPRGGRKPKEWRRVASLIVTKTTQEKPKNATHWSVRTMAKEIGTSRAMVARVWKAHGLQPHRVKGFKLSNDPQFEEKLRDVVGLYLDPPANALVISADEKSQIQALDRSQPGLPIVPGRCGTMTHDYKRNGTTTLFAAIEMAHGKVISACMKRHRHKEWIQFLEKIDEETPAELDLHLIVDNYATHKHPKVKSWLHRHPRFHVHFIPTSSSWLNVIERFFREITEKRIRRGVFRSVPELTKAIQAFIDEHNRDPRPFVWTARADEILEKTRRARAALDKGPSA